MPNENEQTTNLSKESAIDEIVKSFPSPEELLKEYDGESEESSDVKEQSTSVETNKDKPEIKTKDSDVTEDNQEDNLTAIEKEAIAHGWTRKEEWKGDPANWVTAREFVDRTNMLTKIRNQNKEIRNMKETNEKLLKLIQEQSKTLAEEKADTYLKQKRDAIEAGDIQSAEGYEQKYNEAKKQVEGFKELELKIKANSAVDPDVAEFIERNKSWFNDDTSENSAMKEYAIRKEKEYIQKYPAWNPLNILEEVEKSVKIFFRDKFENQNRDRLQGVEKKTRRLPSKREFTYDDLPEEAKEIVDQFSKNNKKVLSKDEYAKKLFLSGAVSYE